ncbi:DUF1187 family protein [Enterobacter asburiae]|nr:DUF1187 family protein [Enterobacter asburiae]EHF5040107.1 DUF1187 family protein [Enterobacter asburiae]EHF5043518.1 DUF1187 family protein [Enterobacter asburiae]EKS6735532.1 DUF1187 family protein [Enterobacter asburiae]EKS6736080.1 DUF1187 family protein [Enterobacter asburiae]
MYLITGLIHKAGGAPVVWKHYSSHKLTLEQCVKMLSRPKAAGKSYGYPVTITDYHCKKMVGNDR